MIPFIRKYASLLVLVLMSVFAVALVLDEYGDCRRAAQDVLIETCAEIEADDYEWDEDGTDNWDGRDNVQSSDVRCTKVLCLEDSTTGLNAVSLSSNEQKRGLVRRYAPRKGFAGAYYI
ncbi:MAG: hypothetical protein IJ581_06045 [Paludibacteraceae bacterium]|nr:hypothetical protein [Paludibacteraceae bacterium]